jgi:hypothetical protein
LNPDGTATIKISSEPMQTGAWVITEDVICVSYQKYGKECNKVLSDGVTIWFVDSVKNKTNNKFTVQKELMREVQHEQRILELCIPGPCLVRLRLVW